MYDIILNLLFYYIYIIPSLIFMFTLAYVLRYKKNFLWLSIISFISIFGMIIIVYAEAIYIDNNGLSGGDYTWVKYFVWATINYILIGTQLYFIKKERMRKI